MKKIFFCWQIILLGSGHITAAQKKIELKITYESADFCETERSRIEGEMRNLEREIDLLTPSVPDPVVPGGKVQIETPIYSAMLLGTSGIGYLRNNLYEVYENDEIRLQREIDCLEKIHASYESNSMRKFILDVNNCDAREKEEKQKCRNQLGELRSQYQNLILQELRLKNGQSSKTALQDVKAKDEKKTENTLKKIQKEKDALQKKISNLDAFMAVSFSQYILDQVRQKLENRIADKKNELSKVRYGLTSEYDDELEIYTCRQNRYYEEHYGPHAKLPPEHEDETFEEWLQQQEQSQNETFVYSVLCIRDKKMEQLKFKQFELSELKKPTENDLLKQTARRVAEEMEQLNQDIQNIANVNSERDIHSPIMKDKRKSLEQKKAHIRELQNILSMVMERDWWKLPEYQSKSSLELEIESLQKDIDELTQDISDIGCRNSGNFARRKRSKEGPLWAQQKSMIPDSLEIIKNQKQGDLAQKKEELTKVTDELNPIRNKINTIPPMVFLLNEEVSVRQRKLTREEIDKKEYKIDAEEVRKLKEKIIVMSDEELDKNLIEKQKELKVLKTARNELQKRQKILQSDVAQVERDLNFIKNQEWEKILRSERAYLSQLQHISDNRDFNQNALTECKLNIFCLQSKKIDIFIQNMEKELENLEDQVERFGITPEDLDPKNPKSDTKRIQLYKSKMKQISLVSEEIRRLQSDSENPEILSEVEENQKQRIPNFSAVRYAQQRISLIPDTLFSIFIFTRLSTMKKISVASDILQQKKEEIRQQLKQRCEEVDRHIQQRIRMNKIIESMTDEHDT